MGVLWGSAAKWEKIKEVRKALICWLERCAGIAASYPRGRLCDLGPVTHSSGLSLHL